MDSTISQNIQFCDGNIIREKKLIFKPTYFCERTLVFLSEHNLLKSFKQKFIGNYCWKYYLYKYLSR